MKNPMRRPNPMRLIFDQRSRFLFVRTTPVIGGLVKSHTTDRLESAHLRCHLSIATPARDLSSVFAGVWSAILPSFVSPVIPNERLQIDGIGSRIGARNCSLGKVTGLLRCAAIWI